MPMNVLSNWMFYSQITLLSDCVGRRMTVYEFNGFNPGPSVFGSRSLWKIRCVKFSSLHPCFNVFQYFLLSCVLFFYYVSWASLAQTLCFLVISWVHTGQLGHFSADADCWRTQIVQFGFITQQKSNCKTLCSHLTISLIYAIHLEPPMSAILIFSILVWG